jgi:hypothetical protein
MYLTYRGDARRPDDTTPLGIPGLPAPLAIGEPVEITDDFAKGHFNCTAKQLCDRLCARYNAGHETPRLESSPSDKASLPKTAKAKAPKRASKPRAPKPPMPTPAIEQTSTDSPPPEPAKDDHADSTSSTG